MNQFNKEELAEILYYLELARARVMKALNIDRSDETTLWPINKIIEKVYKVIKENDSKV